MCLPTKPYKVLSEFEYEGLKCAITQAHKYGHLCGYVRVPPGHPDYGNDSPDVSVHGGVTFTHKEPCAHEDGVGWWIGFDCAHVWEDSLIAPDIEAVSPEEVTWLKMRQETSLYFSGVKPHYWTEPEVTEEVLSLARQLKRGEAYGRTGI